jgi:hypothetical protein
VETYILKDASTFKGYLLPREWYDFFPANDDDDGGGGGGDDEDDDDDNNNYVRIGYIKLT